MFNPAPETNMPARPGIFIPPSNPMPAPGTERMHRTSRTSNAPRDNAMGPVVPPYIPPTTMAVNPTNPVGPIAYEPRAQPS